MEQPQSIVKSLVKHPLTEACILYGVTETLRGIFL